MIEILSSSRFKKVSQPHRCCGEMNQKRTPEEESEESDQNETEELA